MKRLVHIGIVTSLWGVWLLNPNWATFASSPTFQVMQKIAPEWLWGSGFLLLGLSALTAQWQGWRRVEIGVTLVAAFMWGLVTVTFAVSNIAATATPIYGALTLYAADTFSRLFNQYRWSHE